MFRFCLLLCFAVWTITLVISCQQHGRVAPIQNLHVTLDDKVFREVLLELHIAETMATQAKLYRDSIRPKEVEDYYAHVFCQYNTTPEQFKAIFRDYASQPEAFDKLYEELIDRLNKMEAQYENKLPQAKQDKEDKKQVLPKKMPFSAPK